MPCVPPISKLFRTASFKFAALYVALFGFSSVILGSAVFFAARSVLQQQSTSRLQAETDFLSNEYRTGGLDRLVASMRVRGRGVSALDYLLQDGNGQHLAGEIPSTSRIQPGWTTIDNPDAHEDDGRPERVHALVTDLGDGLRLAVGDDVRRVAEVETAIATAFLWTLGLAAILGVGGGMLLSRSFLSRVDGITRTAEAIIEGDLERRVPVRGSDDDLDRLARTLNRMLDRIGALMESIRQVSSDVAHDLRTPLSRLLQGLEYARNHAGTPSEYEEAVERAMREAEALLGTFAALLRIAQVEGAPRSGFREVDLSAVAESVVDAYRPDAEEAGHRFKAHITKRCVVDGDQELLTQAISNLVENALRHTPVGTEICVRVTSGDQTGSLSVEDNGPGISSEDAPRLTRRFFRGERSRTTEGNGLGLSLVSAVAELHRADLQIHNSGPGLRVTLTFPKFVHR